MQIKMILFVLDLTNEQKVPLTAFVLIGEAERWWRIKRDTLPIFIT